MPALCKCLRAPLITHILLGMIILLLFLSALNLNATVYSGPVSRSLGGTGRAGIGGMEGAFLNPATIALLKNYEVDFYYTDGYARDGEHRNAWMVGAGDNTEGVLFPGALHYGRTRDTGRAGAPANGEVWHAAGAYLLSDRLSVGLSAFRLQSKVVDDGSYTQWNGSLGAVVLLNEDLSFGYVLNNLVQPADKVPVSIREEMNQGLGLFYRAADSIILRADLVRPERHNPNKELTYMFGLESAPTELFAARLGYRHEAVTRRKIWAVGVAFTGPRLKIDYSLEKEQEGATGALHSVDMRLPF